MIIKTTSLILAIGIVCLASLPGYADNRDRELNVVTYNMYHGTDFSEIFAAQSQLELLSEAAEAYADVVSGNPNERIDEIANQIASNSPALVGLQEVALWQTGAFNDPAPATTVSYDFLEMLLAELAERGSRYQVVAVQTNLEAELPAAGPGVFADVRFTDRVVIIARSDLQTSQLKLENSQAQPFSNLLTVPTLIGPVTVERGWTAVDVKMRGKTFRFVNAHLESFVPFYNYLQGAELLAGPANTSLPVILVGDLNSDAEAAEPTYQLLLSGGLLDAWELANPSDPGYTWALFIESPAVFTTPSQRLDLILKRGEINVINAEVIGEDPVGDVTASGLRPSDHAGVTAALILEP